MRLSCPQCQTEYEVPDSALAGRARILRCADCGAQFKAPALPVAEPEPEPLPLEATAPEVEPEPEIAASPETMEPAMAQAAFTEVPVEEAAEPTPALAAIRPSPPVQPKPVQAAPNRALSISALIVLLIIAVVLVEHRVIAQAWPPSLRLFNALGMR